MYTSKERVRAAVMHKDTDVVPANFECVGNVMDRLKAHFGFTDDEQVRVRLGSDIRGIQPKYIGPELKGYTDSKGNRIWQGFWGDRYRVHWNGKGYESVPCDFQLDNLNTIEALKNYNWPRTEWFDYESIKVQCEMYKDKAITIGYQGPFQFATHLRSMDKIMMDMVLEPEYAHYLFDRMLEFELEHYEKMLIAADGQIDILKACDDYGTQRGLLFSTDMWEEYFKENTKKLVDLAHRYGAMYHQHSCGAMEPLIPGLIECGIDILEPLQKLPGMDPKELKAKYGDQVTFLGGVDTQTILPFGTPEEVYNETKQVVDTLSRDGGYILMASQSFESDVPVENILAMYSVRDPSLWQMKK